MIILGLNAHHPDSAACILVDGQVVAAIEEERFTRIKHDMSFPLQSIRWCLQEAKIRMQEVDHVAINRSPFRAVWNTAIFHKIKRMGRGHLPRFTSLRDQLAHHFDCIVTARIHHVEHHLAHAASSFFFSPFPSSAILTIDGMGDLCSTLWARGEDNRITEIQRVRYPHSLGILYTANTQYLGFENYGDEYKVMALAALGKRRWSGLELIQLKPHGRFELDLSMFTHHLSGSVIHEKNGKPEVMRLFAGEPRWSLENMPKEDLAAWFQAIYEQTLMHMVSGIQSNYLCLAGGCAQNTVANGKLLKYFDHIYVPPAPADDGGALGAAIYVWCQKLGKPRPEPMMHANCGYHQEIHVDAARLSRPDLIAKTVRQLIAGKLVGWFQGPMEFGPRALGNRSILADPRRGDLKDKLNSIVKHREPWRPFGMSILRDHVTDYFAQDVESPFMSFTLPVRDEKQKTIPAVVHVDGTSRLHTVTRRQNPLFWELLMEFYKQTGVPLLLNTSFNDQAPIVRTSHEAWDVFKTTELDVLVMGAHLWKK